MRGEDRPFVSVIMPCRNELRFIERCLESIFANDYPADRFEVIVADGRSEDGTRAIIERFARTRPSLRLIDNPRCITPCALNAAIRAARGDIIVRVDAHVLYPVEYIRQLVEGLLETGADCVGGVLKTIPAVDTVVAQAVALGMSHPFGVGDSRFRIGTTVRREIDHVPFFCCRRAVFDRVGLFDEELIRNQDGEFSWRLRRSGGRILLLPEVTSFYFARETLGKLARMLYQYGYFKPLSMSKIGRAVTLRQFAPSALLLGLAGTGLGALLWSPLAMVFVALVLTYGTALAACAIAALRHQPMRVAIALLAVFPTMHLSYGVGFLRRSLELAAGVRRAKDAVLVPLTR